MDKRKYTRIITSLDAKINLDNIEYEVTILDLSLNGALITSPAGIIAMCGTTGNLTLRLTLESTITFAFEVSHIENDTWGVKVKLTDIESITHLRRLIELNLGDSQILDRELINLSAS